MQKQWPVESTTVVTDFCRSLWVAGRSGQESGWVLQRKEEVKAKYPTHGAIRALQAEDLWHKGDTTGAKKLLAKAWGQSTKEIALASFVAEVTFQTGDSTLAISRLKNGLRQTPSSVLLRTTLAELLIASDKGSEALAELEALLHYEPGNTYGTYLLARLHAHSLRPSDSEAYLKKLLENDKDFIPAYTLLFEVLLQQQKYNEAKKQFEEYARKGTPRPSEITQFMILLVASKQFSSAISFGSSYADTFKSGDSFYKWMALAYAETGQHSNALTSFSQCAVEHLKTDDWLKRAQSAIAIGQHNEAKKWLEQELRKGEQEAVCFLLGELNLRDKLYEEAIRNYSCAVALAGTSVKVYYGLGRAYYYKGSYTDAFQCFQVMDSLLPDHTLPTLWLGRTMAASDPESVKGLAKPYYQKLTELQATTGDDRNKILIEAYSYLGYQYLLENKKTESIKAWEQVKKLDPTHPKALEALNYLKP
jgi:predicted Zn-dependent protease